MSLVIAKFSEISAKNTPQIAKIGKSDVISVQKAAHYREKKTLVANDTIRYRNSRNAKKLRNDTLQSDNKLT